MTEPRRQRELTDAELEPALIDLGRHLDYPEQRNLAPAVRARLTAAPQPKPAFWSRFIPSAPHLQVAYGLLVVVLVLAAALVVSPSTRTAIADRLGLPGVSISTEPTVVLAGSALQIGEPVTLDAARHAVEYELVAPPVGVLGEPDEVYLLRQPAGVQVSYVYRPDDGLPEVGNTGVGLLISQFEGRTDQNYIRKQLGRDTILELVEVGGARGFWLAGEPHVFYYEDPTGVIQEESIRIAGNVLLWEHDGKTLRIESTLAKDEVVRIAESMMLE